MWPLLALAWGPPPSGAAITIVLGTGVDERSVAPTWARRACTELVQVATVHNSAGVSNQEQGTRVFRCSRLNTPWPQLWPHVQHLG